MGSPVVISVIADTRHATEGLRQTGQAAENMGGRFKAAAGAAAALVGAAAGFAAIKVGGFLKDAVVAASDLNETLSKTSNVFGKSAADILEWSKTSANSFGISRDAALGAAAMFGDMFTQLGFGAKDVAANSKAVIGLAADLGSFHNVDPTDVLNRVSAAFRGEYDSLQALIPNINAARVEQEAMALTGKKVAKELTAQEKAAATLAIIQKDSALATNDFAETQGGLANQMRIAKAQVANFKSEVGQALLPVVAQLATVFTTQVMPALNELWATHGPQVTATLSNMAASLGKVDWANTFGTAVEKIRDALRNSGPALRQFATDAGPGLGDTVSVFGTVIRFAADHVDLLAKALPYLAAGFLLVKTAQVGANVAATISPALRIAEVIANRRLAASNVELIATMRAQSAAARTSAAATTAETAATNGGILARGRAVVSMVAQRVAMVATAAATKAWAAVQWLLNAALTANPIGLIVVGIAALVAGVIIAYKKSDTFRKIVDKAMKDVGKAFAWMLDVGKKVFGWLKDNWKTILMIITGPVGIAVGLVIKYWDQIKSATTKAFEAVKSAVSKALDAVRSVVSSVTSWVLARIKDYVGLYVAAWNGIVELYHFAMRVKDWVVSAIGALVGAVQNHVRNTVAGALAVWEGIVGLWHKALWVRDAVIGAVSNIVGGVRDWLANAVNTAIGVWGRIMDLAGTAWRMKDSILGVFSGAWQWLVSAGEDVVRGLISGIDRAYGWLRDKLSGLGWMIPDWLKKVLGIASPSKVMAGIGREVMRGLVGGIDATEPLLQRTLDGVGETIAGLGAEPHVGLRVDAAAVAGGRPGGGGVVNVTVNVPPTADLAEVGRQIVKAQKAYATSVGRAVVITP